MDLKATAKSKRSHSLHGKKNHPSPSAVAQKKKATAHNTDSSSSSGGAAVEEKPRHGIAPALPSNWDRYEEEEEGGEHGRGENTSLVGEKYGEVLPKSKGADFRYLVEQARAQPLEVGDTGLMSSNFKEISLNFKDGRSSMIAVRGKCLLSWCEDDSFIIDDEPTTGFEVPYLSMDLNALAAQLLKLKTSERLFIEPELLLEEQATNASEGKHQLEPSSTLVDTELNNNAHKESDNSSLSMQPESNQSQVSMGKAAVFASSGEPDKLGSSDHRAHEEMNYSVQQSGEHARPKAQNPLKFEAAAAEAELDMLLNSLEETTFYSSVTDSLNGNVSSLQITDPDPSPSSSSMPAVDISAFLSSMPTNSFDDELDDLLAQTSSAPGKEDDKGSAQKSITSTNIQQYPPRMSSNPPDDFDSWLDSL